MKNLLLFFLAITGTVQSFNTLDELNTYAAYITEFPEPDNNNWNDPIFSSYYKSIEPGFFKRMLNFFTNQHVWNPLVFKEELIRTVKWREQQNLSGRQVAKLVLDGPATLYVFGDVQGHFHSLMRSLTFLHEKNIIDKQLNITSPDTYIIFNGDSVDRAAYSLETLQTIMLLLNRNPDQVFYIRGKHEDKSYWQNFGLKRELKERAKGLVLPNSPAYEIPLGDLIQRFFETLPLALYISEKNNPLDLIRFSHAGRDNPELREDLFDNFFEHDLDKKISYYDVRRKNKTSANARIKALITTEEWLKEHRAHTGLGILDQDLGTTAWSIVSTPIRAYQKYYGFYYDAFVEIKVAPEIEKSIITVWNRNIQQTGPFQPKEAYIISSSMPLNGKKTSDTTLPDIKIGATMPLNRGIAIMGQRIKRGMDIRINEANKNGGINGQHISTIVYNDDYTPFIARQNIERLINEHNTRLIVLTVGSQIFEGLLDFIKEGKITAIFPTNGSPDFRKAEYTNLVNFGPSYEDEIEILMNYLFTEYGARKFLFFYQNDAYGIGLLNEAHKQLKARGINDWVDVPYVRGETNFKKQADTIKNAQVDTVGLFSTAKATEELIRQIGVDELANKKVFGVSYLGEVSFREFIKSRGLPVILGAVVPNPATSKLEAAANYRKAMDENNLPYDVFSFQAFFATSLLLDVMQRIQGPVTREKIVEKLEAFYDDKFEGFTLTFNPATRSIARYVWIETGENEDWIEKKIKSTLD